MNQNQTQSKPTDAEQLSGKGLDGTICSRLVRCGCGSEPKIKYDSECDRGDYGYNHVTWVECRCGMQTRKLHWWTFGKSGEDGSEKAVAIWNICLSANA